MNAPIILSLLSGGRGRQVEYWLDERILLALSAWMCYNDDNWGCDELVKRIPCRVVRSVPFQKGDDASRINPFEVMHSEGRRVGAGQAGFKTSSNANGCIFQAESVKAAFGESAVGLLLDCLA